jgi:hypothetical protein
MVKIQITLQQAKKGPEWERRYSSTLSLTSALDGGRVVNATPRPFFAPGKDPVPLYKETGWTPGPFWTGVENLAHIGIRSPDRPTCSQSLY